jgi:5-methylcytosine-specific restriction endonuclease McrA
MIAIHLEKVKNVQSLFLNDIEKHRSNAIKKLSRLSRSRVKLSQQEKSYLTSVINLYNNKNILVSTPNEITALKQSIGKLPINSRKPKLSSLKSLILEKLNYTGLRSTFYPKYFSKLNIRACVYCNSTLTIGVELEKNIYSARFDLDHYHSKDDYPFLSIFLFNLYPSCASCNRRKGKKKVDFNLYSDNLIDTKKSSFQFKLDRGAKAKYLLTKDINDLKFSFQPSSNPLQKRFRIEELYSTQKDLIEDLIVKQAMYDKYSRMNLLNNFSKLNLKPDLFLRSLLGNYIRESEIHNRPMAKFMQDIAKDLDLI